MCQLTVDAKTQVEGRKIRPGHTTAKVEKGFCKFVHPEQSESPGALESVKSIGFVQCLRIVLEHHFL